MICNAVANYCFRLNTSVDTPQQVRISKCYWLKQMWNKAQGNWYFILEKVLQYFLKTLQELF